MSLCGFQFTQPFPISRKLFDSYGPLLFYGSIASYIVYIGFQLGGNFWLTVWTSDPQANTDPGVRDMYLGIYGLLGIFQVNSFTQHTRSKQACSFTSVNNLPLHFIREAHSPFRAEKYCSCVIALSSFQLFRNCFAWPAYI